MLVAACAVYAQIPNVSGRVTSTDGSPSLEPSSATDE